MFDVGFGELFFFGIIIIIVLGPDRLPEAIRFAIKTIKKFSQIKSDIKQKLDLELELHQLRDELKDELKNVKQLENYMQNYFTNLDQQVQKDMKKYYPVQSFSLSVPFKTQFVITHLMQWSCFSLKAVGVQ